MFSECYKSNYFIFMPGPFLRERKKTQAQWFMAQSIPSVPIPAGYLSGICLIGPGGGAFVNSSRSG